MQEKAIGKALKLANDLPALQRGDLVFWPGHVAIMIDEVNIIHANAFHMMVAIEPLQDAIQRIQATTKTAVRSIKRPF
jgi:cell wall-associated NlpC family hydrolase